MPSLSSTKPPEKSLISSSKLRSIPILLLLTFFAVAMTAVAANKRADNSRIEGTWTIVKAELGGSPLPAEVIQTITLNMEDGKYQVKAENLDKGTYTMDASTKPKTLDIVGMEGPNTGKHFQCIYELKGDVLKICYQLGAGPRPTEFKSPAGTKIFLVTYKRKKG